MLNDIDQIFKDSTTNWFRARTYHEYGTIRRYVRSLVDLDRVRVLDFGCGGLPIASASMALRHPESVVFGTDIERIDRDYVDQVMRRESGLALPDNLNLYSVPPGSLPDEIQDLDLAYSWSVFEHIPAGVLTANFRLVYDRLAKGGVFFFQIGGLYFHTLGSHLAHYFPGEPWHHLSRSLEEIRSHVFSSDKPEGTKQREWQQFIELNRLTADDFLDAAQEAGFTLVSQERIEEGDPPASLLRIYSSSTLKTFEIRAVFKKL